MLFLAVNSLFASLIIWGRDDDLLADRDLFNTWFDFFGLLGAHLRKLCGVSLGCADVIGIIQGLLDSSRGALSALFCACARTYLSCL